MSFGHPRCRSSITFNSAAVVPAQCTFNATRSALLGFSFARRHVLASALVGRIRNRSCSCRCPASASQAATEPTAVPVVPQPRWTVVEVLQRVSRRLAHDQTAHEAHEVVYRGSGLHMGMHVAWSLRCRGNGAFVEEVVGEHLRWSWGSDGGGSCWEVDDAGVSKRLELDDNESCLLATWLRGGFWLQPAAAALLDIWLLEDQSIVQTPGSDGSWWHADQTQAKVATLHSASSAPETGLLCELTAAQQEDSVASHPGRQQAAEDAARPTGSLHVPLGGASASTKTCESREVVVLGLRLRSGKVVAQLHIDCQEWLPRQLLQPLCGNWETWQYDDYRPHTSSKQGGAVSSIYPATLRHLAAAGGTQLYAVDSVCVTPAAAAAAAALLSGCPFAMPPEQLLPADAAYDEGRGAHVDVWHARSGHLLVKPKVDGQEVGYMIVDTGATGFVIEQAAADALGLPAFGKLYVSGMVGRVRCQFRRAAAITLGPLTVARPLFMEMALSGLVAGAPGPVVGIIGYDLFRRSVVELPALKQPAAGAARQAGPLRMALHPPQSYAPSRALHWQPLRMIANLPYLQASLPAAALPQHAPPLAAAPPSIGCHATREQAAATAAVTPQQAPLAPMTGSAALNMALVEGQEEHSALFMLDSGAGGVDVIFHKRAVREMSLRQRLVASGGTQHQYLKGVGGQTAAGTPAQAGELPWLRLGAGPRTVCLPRVRCLLAGGGVDLSAYTAGIICGDLLGRCRVVLDYSRQRIALDT